MSAVTVENQNGQTNGTKTEIVKQAAPVREIRVVEDDGPNACLLDTARFEHMHRIASIMASASLIPEHLAGKVEKNRDTEWYSIEQVRGNCFLIVNQALRWGFDPFAVAAETYVVKGKLGFQGKLIAALVNAKARLKKRLSYTYNDGKGDALEVTVHGTFEGEDEEKTVTLTVGQGKTTNSMWSTDPKQKLIYSGATKWARAHCPEIILGVFSDDDIDRMAQRTIEATAKPKRIADLVAASQSQMESAGSTEQPAEEKKPVETPGQKQPNGESQFEACSKYLDDKKPSGVKNIYSDATEGLMKYSLPNGETLTICDGAKPSPAPGFRSVDTRSAKALQDVRDIVEIAIKTKV